jgi:hypothetical protein
MQNSANDFLKSWKAKYVTGRSNEYPEAIAKILALRCWRDAARAGISTSVLFAAAGGDLVGNMLGTLNSGEPLTTPLSWDE